MSGEDMYGRYLDGDEFAFEGLVSLYKDELYLFINRMVRDSHEAKHLMIETFARLAVECNYAGRSSIRAYIFGIGRNLSLKAIKRRKCNRHISLDELVEAVADSRDTPEQTAIRNEDMKRLHEALRLLKDEYRVVLMLLYFEDMSYHEAGKKMKKSEKQIRNLAYRAKISLKRKIED